ncbi:MAG: hypothetical protein WKF73_05600 [Nocardioidaceae bacterium]
MGRPHDLLDVCLDDPNGGTHQFHGLLQSDDSGELARSGAEDFSGNGGVARGFAEPVDE